MSDETLGKTLDFLSKLNSKTVQQQREILRLKFYDPTPIVHQDEVEMQQHDSVFHATRNNMIDWMRDVVQFGLGLKKVTNLADLGQLQLYLASYHRMQVKTKMFSN